MKRYQRIYRTYVQQNPSLVKKEPESRYDTIQADMHVNFRSVLRKIWAHPTLVIEDSGRMGQFSFYSVPEEIAGREIEIWYLDYEGDPKVFFDFWNEVMEPRPDMSYIKFVNRESMKEAWIAKHNGKLKFISHDGLVRPTERLQSLIDAFNQQ